MIKYYGTLRKLSSKGEEGSCLEHSFEERLVFYCRIGLILLTKG